MAELDLDPMDAFEARFAARLGAYAAIPVAPVDAAAVAHDVVGRRRRRALDLGVLRVPAVAWVLLALATAVAGGLLVGALLQRLNPAPRAPLVLATETGLFVGADDGSDRQPIRTDGSFMLPRWSPSGDLIAVLHGPPIDPQAGAGGAPRTGDPFRLEAVELLILDPDGATRGSVVPAGDRIVGFEWGPPGADGRSLLAVRLAAGPVVVVDDGGRRVLRVAVDDPIAAADAPLLRPGLAWQTPRVLLATAGSEVLRLDVDSPDGRPAVVRVDDGRINDIALAPDGRTLAFVAAACRTACRAEMRVARVEPSQPTNDGGPVGRVVLVDIEAATALSWEPGGERVLAWPMVATTTGSHNGGGIPVDGALASRDVRPAWTRYAGDGSGRIVAHDTFNYFNDRHFDAWLVRADGSVVRLDPRSLGADLRSTTPVR